MLSREKHQGRRWCVVPTCSIKAKRTASKGAFAAYPHLFDNMGGCGIPRPLDSLSTSFSGLIAEQTESISRWDRFFKLKKKSPLARVMGKGRLCVMGLCGVGESHAPDAFAAVLNPTTDTHLSATRIHNDGIMQGAALPSTPPVWVATMLPSRTLPPYSCFYPRHPCGWRRSWFMRVRRLAVCFYPRHPCGWRLTDLTPVIQSIGVSIHATRVGGDLKQ